MERLKEACISVAQEALKPVETFDGDSKQLTEKLDRLYTELQAFETTPPTKQAVSNFVFFPIRQLLQQNHLSNNNLEFIFKIIAHLSQNTWTNNDKFEVGLASQMLTVTSYLLNPAPPESTSPSEQFMKSKSTFRIAGFECINGILTAANSNQLNTQLSQTASIPNIIILLLDGIQYDFESLDAQISGLKCLNTLLTQTIVNPDHLALILPRTVSKLTNFIGPANKRHFRAKIMAIDLLKAVISKVISTPNSKTSDTDWMQETFKNLETMLIVVSKLATECVSSIATRPELVKSIYEFTKSLLTECANEFDKYSPSGLNTLIEILYAMKIQTIDLNVQNAAASCLENCPPPVTHRIMEMGLESVKNWRTSLERTDSLDSQRTSELVKTVLTTNSESVPLVLSSLQEALTLNVPKHSSTQAKQLVSAPSAQIRTITPYKTSEIPTFSELGLTTEISESNQHQIWQVLALIGSSKTFKPMQLITQNLLTSSKYRGSLETAQNLWLASGIIQGIESAEDSLDVLQLCLDLVVNEIEDLAPSVSASNAITTLSLYFIGEAALKYGTDFQPFIIDVIHPLFCMLGDMNSLTSRIEASNTLAKVAFACGYPSATAMAVENHDYLTDGLAIQLMTLNFSPATPEALASLIYICGTQIVPYLTDIFTTLFEIMDQYHGYYKLVRGVMTVFGALTAVLKSQISLPKTIEAPKPTNLIPNLAALVAEMGKKASDQIPKSTLAELNEEIEQNKPKEGDSDDETEEVNVPPEEEEVWDHPISQDTYKVLEKIADYCDKLMTHETPEIRVASLSLVSSLAPFLALSEKNFLPLIHRTWPEVCTRIFDPQVYVVEVSFQCLETLTFYAKDFVAKRIDDLWPKISAHYSKLLLRKWPQFANEQRILTALASCFKQMLLSIDNLSLITLESALMAFKPAFLRKEFGDLQLALTTVKPSTADLLWIVMQQTTVYPGNDVYFPVEPVYT